MTQPRCWINDDNYVGFRTDINPAEVEELRDMVVAAFNQGFLSGYKQGRDKTGRVTTQPSRKEKR